MVFVDWVRVDAQTHRKFEPYKVEVNKSVSQNSSHYMVDKGFSQGKNSLGIAPQDCGTLHKVDVRNQPVFADVNNYYKSLEEGTSKMG